MSLKAVKKNKEREIEQLKSKLREIFQFDAADLDFGIYRIMNQKRDAIEKFIEKDIVDTVEKEFEEYESINKKQAREKLNELKNQIKKTLGEKVFNELGEIDKNYDDAPIVQEYKKQKKLLSEIKITDQQKAEIFSDIKTFFSRYYKDGDFISLRRYSNNEKYAIPYNGEEVLLYWANKDQYYTKTDEFFYNYDFFVSGYKIKFCVNEAQIDINNLKRQAKYFTLSNYKNIKFDENNKELIIYFNYRELDDDEKKKYGKKNIQDKIIDEAIKNISQNLENKKIINNLIKKEFKNNKSFLEYHVNRYVKRNTKDYFINKNLEKFLKKELNFYIKNEIFKLDDLGTTNEDFFSSYISRVKVMKKICLKIIQFLSQIEEFQKKLWEKKKFVISTDYLITLDYINEKFYPEIIKNKNQLNEWKKLFSFDLFEEIDKQKSKITEIGKNREDIIKKILNEHQNLIIDTGLFNTNFKYCVLNEFSDLEEKISGILINSENFQALNLLTKKYKEKIKCCCIDPPYNTGGDEFLYKDGFNSSSWLSFMKDRLQLAHFLLNESGVIFTNIDDNEVGNLIKLKKQIFGEDFVETYIWDVRVQGQMPKTPKKTVRKEHEYIITGFKQEKVLNKYSSYKHKDKDWSNPDNDPRGPWMSANISRGSGKASGGSKSYTITNPKGERFYRDWSVDEKEFKKLLLDNRIYFSNDGAGVPRKKIFKNEPVESMQSSIFEGLKSSQFGSKEIKKLFGKSILQYPKPTNLIKRLCKIGSSKDDLIIDFFAGSGTTGHAILSLNKKTNISRKFILVEMGSYFSTMLKPRIAKVIYSNKWKKGRPLNYEGINKQIIKYHKFEQYEDTLNNIEFLKGKTEQKTLNSVDDYFLKYMLDFETKNSMSRLNIDCFKNPFNYILKVDDGGKIVEKKVDLVETFNYLIGLQVKEIKFFENEVGKYIVVHGYNPNEVDVTVVWRDTENLDFKKDKNFVEDFILKKFPAEKIYINGDSHVENGVPIEEEFMIQMGG